jgi:hypothetical protein
MKKHYLSWVAIAVTNICLAQTIFINEIHYENTGGDFNEGIEIAGPEGTDLVGYQIRLYNSSGSLYSTILYLSGIIPNQQNNMGTLWFSREGIQNGPSDGIALVDNLGNVIQFLSYGGIVTANEGPANGMTSTDIGVIEDETTPSSYSLQLIGSGSNYSDFTWIGPIENTRGLPNNNQTLPVTKNEIEGFALYPNPVSNGKLYMTSPNRVEKHVQIYSLLGNKVYDNIVASRREIEISNLTKGFYMVRVEEEGKIATRKLIIN